MVSAIARSISVAFAPLLLFHEWDLAFEEAVMTMRNLDYATSEYDPTTSTWIETGVS